MSIQSEVERLSANVQNTLEAIRQTGVSVPENATCDALPAAAAALANEKQDKLTGAQGQVVGFDSSGNAVAQAAPQTGLTQEQADQRYVQQQNGNLVSTLGLIPSGNVVIQEGFDSDEARIYPLYGEGGNPRLTIYAGTRYMEFNANDEQIRVSNPINSDNVANKWYVDREIDSIDLPLAFGPQTVATSAWAANTTYSAQGYGFRASVPLSGVTADYIPDVTFAMADAVSGNLAPLAESYAGGIYIYAKEQPTATVNIASVVCTKGA